MATRLQLHLLGTFQAALDGQPLTGFRSDKIRALLAYLAAEPRSHTRDHLATLLWGEYGQQAARTSLRKALSNLRHLLPDLRQGDPPALTITRQSVQLHVDHEDVHVDVVTLRQLLAAVQTHDHGNVVRCDHCRQQLATAAALYHGDFLAGFTLADAPAFTDWQLLLQEQLHQQAITAMETLAEAALADGDHDAGQATLRQLLRLVPWHEQAHRQLMTSLFDSGRRSQALAQFEACRAVLDEELGVEPAAETRLLYEAIRSGERLPAVAPSRRRDNLPAPTTPLIGRQSELAELESHLLDDSRRLITILGPGGVGKTRLALAAAGRAVVHFPEGVWLVSLATMDEDGPLDQRLATAIAGALNLSLRGTAPPLAQLAAYLSRRHLLLLLDNLEPYLPAAATPLLHLLDEAPRLTLLATSQARLNLRAETLLTLSGLALRGREAPAAEQRQSAAVTLFAERARRAYPDFDLTRDDLPAVVDICHLLEGMPLGIELAASLTAHFTCPEIAETIEHNLSRLAVPHGDLPPRQRSLEAMWEYTWQWLTPAEQQALAEASVFPGEFSRDALLAVTTATLADLISLVNKSLLRAVSPGHYTMHGLIRHFAAAAQDREPSNRQAAVRARHSRFYARFLAEQEPALHDERQQATHARLRRCLDNVHLAWEWAVAQPEPDLLAMMLDPLAIFYDDHGRYREGIRRFRTVAGAVGINTSPLLSARMCLWQAHFHYRLGQAEAADPLLVDLLARPAGEQPELRARIHYLQGCLSMATGDPEQSLSLLAPAHDHYRASGNNRALASTLNIMGRGYELLGRYDDARATLRQSLELKRQQGAPVPIASALSNLGLLLHRCGEEEEAQKLFQEALALYEALGNEGEIASTLSNLGLVALGRGDYQQARRYLERALPIQQKVGHQQRVAIIFNNLGDVANALGDYQQARAYLERSLALKRAAGNRRGMIFSLIHLGHALMGQQQYADAGARFREALALATDLGVEPLQLAALVGEAERQATAGHLAGALALLDIVQNHPAAWQRTHDEAARLATELSAESPPEATSAPSDRPEALREIIARLLASAPLHR